MPSVSSTARDYCIERDRKWMGYMQYAQDNSSGFMHDFASKVGKQLDSVPTLFLPIDYATYDAVPVYS